MSGIGSSSASKTTGPNSSTDNAVARFDGTSGTILKNSGVLIDDSDNVTGVESLALNQPLTVPNGGIGANSLTANQLLIGKGMAGIEPVGAMSDGQIVIGADGGAPQVGSIQAGDNITVTNSAGGISIAAAAGLPSASGIAPGGQLINGFDGAEWFDPRKHIIMYDDFGTGRNQSWLNWDSDNGGGTVRGNELGVSTNPGFLQLETDASTTSGPYIYLGEFGGYGPLTLGGGRIYMHWIVKLSALSDGTDTYSVEVGIGDTQGVQTNSGVWMSYTHSANSGNWVANTSDGGTNSTGNGDIAASTDWVVLGMDIAADASSVSFYVDGTQIDNSPITSNIPTSDNLAPFAIIQKSAGTNERELYLDQFYLFQTLTASR